MVPLDPDDTIPSETDVTATIPSPPPEMPTAEESITFLGYVPLRWPTMALPPTRPAKLDEE
jgi:hypothetical protein